MINKNIKSNHIQIENLFKSIFTEVPNTSIVLNERSVIISHDDSSNSDAASIEIVELSDGYKISYWDGYSLAEEEDSTDLKKSLKIFKRYSKKLAKNLNRFSQ
tara:strand:+ start:182 stop:490 length:309 start_codon:yes stop_codon:yes gene_type:complete